MQRLSKDGHAHSVTADTMKRLRLPQIAILVGAGVAACSDYRSGPKLPPRVKIDALIRDRAIRKQWYTAPQNGKRPGLSER
ncbi:hypothetical protein HaLaN_01608 [Haematococcus lacustris]|uniref:Uncharacterized protein n=1 Tax=Haematococcus lacustris TaxID=44745 RepID=A0A699YV43_HAELA|nr:hypothetical protein HaLaN_01608 [Haematococcus lacustris]